jgi:hypothetical protein
MGAPDSRSLRSETYVRMQGNTSRSSIYLCSLSTGFWGCAARILATPFCRSSWYFGFLPSLYFAGGQFRCCGMSPCSSGLGLWSFSSFYSLFDWWFPLFFLTSNFDVLLIPHMMYRRGIYIRVFCFFGPRCMGLAGKPALVPVMDIRHLWFFTTHI